MAAEKSKKTTVYVLHDQHSGTSIDGVVTDKSVATKWKAVDPSYRFVVEVKLDDKSTVQKILLEWTATYDIELGDGDD